MQVTKTEFLISAVSAKQYPPDDLPEIVMVGRSNVGKSSLINTLINRKRLARTSSKPGKTQTINFYVINDAFYFVDVPGYGYAHVPKSVQESWGNMMKSYLMNRSNITALIQILDLRHQPTEADVQMYNFCTHYDLPIIVVATKADKISRGQQQRYTSILRKTLSLPSSVPLILFSSSEKTGKDKLWAEIEGRLAEIEGRLTEKL